MPEILSVAWQAGTPLPPASIAAVQRAAATLAGGGLVAVPTETVYGLAAVATDADAVAAAQDMSDEDRNAMIQGMVDRLADRLATEGGTPEEWARLITALGVLGQTDRAKAIWTEAKAVFADQPAALDVLTAAALQAGLSE